MTLTFLLSDIEGSTRLWEEHHEAMQRALLIHDRLVSETVSEHGGRLIKAKGEGDSTFSVFEEPASAVAAALEMQRALEAKPSPTPVPLAVRVAVHVGEAEERDADFYGPVVNRCARLRAIGHGGQILLSASAAELVRNRLPPDAYLRDLGMHRLKDLAAPERVFQLSHPELRDGFPPLESLEARPNNLPIQLTTFVGRDRELADLRQQLSGHRLVTLTGIGGCGKTRLALHAAADAVDSHPDGVWFVEFAALSDPALVEQQVAMVLGVREGAAKAGPSSRSLTDLIVEYLGARRTLMLFDNCEHLVEACAHLAERLLRSCPALTVLATSREPLGVGGEVTVGVPSLAVTDEVDPLDIKDADAIRLFVDRARLVVPGFGLDAENAPFVTSICRRLDGIPLAIELAAARVRSLTPEQIDARLTDRFRLLARSSRTSLPRHQTLAAAIDWSHRLLSEPEEMLFRRLSVFAGGFSLEAAEQVCGEEGIDVLLSLSTLVEKSLVIHVAPESRYRMLETIRQFAWEKLIEAEEVDEMRRRHREWVVAVVGEGEPAGASAQRWRSELETEQDNLRATLDWEGPLGDSGETRLRLAAAAWSFWWARARMGEGRAWIERALQGAPEASAAARAKGLMGAGVLAQEQGDAASALAYYEKSRELFEQLGDRAEVAAASIGLGQVAMMRGKYDHARGMFEQALRQARAVEHPFYAGLAVNHLGMLIHAQGDPGAARPLYEEARATWKSGSVDPQGAAIATLQIGLSALETGDDEAARSCLLEGLRTTHEGALAVGVLMALEVAGAYAASRERWGVAARLLGAAEGLRDSNKQALQEFAVRAHRSAVSALEKALGPATLRSLWEEGRAMSLEQTTAYALENI